MDIYPCSIVGIAKKNKQPPRCIFVPTPIMAKAMVRAILSKPKNESDENFLLKFGLIEEFNMETIHSEPSTSD